jgi:peptidoglycan/xylan/chitin deacetylase (PgdA/CDA1 family)
MKVKGALYSFEACGTLGDVLVFSKRKTGQQVRYQRPPVDAKSDEQLTVRESFTFGTVLWSSMPLDEKNYWDQIEKWGFANV